METSLIADTICRTVELGLTITGAAIGEQFTHIDCRPVEQDPNCPECGQPGQLRDHIDRVLTDLPVVGHPTRLNIRIPRFTCNDPDCSATVFRQRLDRVAAPKAGTTRRCARWILQRLAIDKMSVSAVANALGLSWGTVNTLALSMARHLVHGQPGHLDGVRVLGVDEHKWKHVRGQGDPSFVTVIVDLTPVIDGTGPARLFDMVPGRSAAAVARLCGLTRGECAEVREWESRGVRRTGLARRAWPMPNADVRRIRAWSWSGPVTSGSCSSGSIR